jgi:hypothetical protein
MKTRILQFIKVNIVVSMLVGVSFFLLTPFAAAQETTITKSKGLTISPLRSELSIEPGTSIDGVLTVTNSTNNPMTVDLSAEEFSVINQQYDYAFTTESDVTKWVSFNTKEFILTKSESKNISYRVSVPLSTEPGGRYVSLLASTDAGLSQNGVQSFQRIASLLYITVSGDITRAGNLISLSTPWFISGESVWSTAIQNTGTTHFRSRYNVQIKNLLGSGVVADMSGDALILPGTVRLVSDVLPSPTFPGIYKAIYTIGLGDTPAKTETRLVLFLPPWITIIITAVTTLIIFQLWRKQFNKR